LIYKKAKIRGKKKVKNSLKKSDFSAKILLDLKKSLQK